MTADQKKQILGRMQIYCALEDRSIQKVMEKLNTIEEISERDRDEIITSLIEDRFLDEERFVESYVRSKVNQNRWGRQKIKHGLIRHQIPDRLIEEGLQNIDRDTYSRNLIDLLDKKKSTSNDPAAWVRYLVQKGYEYEEIMELIEN